MPHNLEMPQYVIDRIMAKRGKLEVFDRFDPATDMLVPTVMGRHRAQH